MLVTKQETFSLIVFVSRRFNISNSLLLLVVSANLALKSQNFSMFVDELREIYREKFVAASRKSLYELE